LGEAYQVADDIRDVIGQSADLGKPTGQDAQHGRPSVAHELGLNGAIGYFENLINQAVAAVPQVASADKLRQIVRMESERLVPSSICQSFKSAAASASSLQH
jgi:geranylgeranyl diphosphate synthase type II